MKSLIYKIKRKWYKLTNNTAASRKLKIQQFRDLGGKCGERFVFLCEIPVEPYLIEIGDDVTAASGVVLLTHDYSISKCGIDATDYFGRIKIGNGSFIGINSIILPGVTLGDHTIVGAGSVVTKSFPEGNVVIAGNPAKPICSISQFAQKRKDISFNLDKDGLRQRKREFLSSLPDEKLEHR